jgi:hypothetical protein
MSPGTFGEIVGGINMNIEGSQALVAWKPFIIYGKRRFLIS